MTIRPPHPLLKSGKIGIKEVQCAETYKLTISFFCDFYFWRLSQNSYKNVKNGRIFLIREDALCSETDATPIFTVCDF